MSNAILVIGILILVAVLFFGYTALAKKYLNEEKEGKPKVKDLVSLSKRGSILFYIFLILLFIFFLVMYIMWKLQ